ncbi:aminodeoxychorismate/anthranilate synthase component II [Apibacter raozihei]|uniref:anthranilate synthase component II n=1 Tax=Apibacter TaxID=1778601 RepID=UPI000FE3A931|nr:MULTISPECIES: aminodeoxychorismate/anthranilate synthase component II [Apibacter]
MKILIFDNYDSFTYNLVHMVKELGYMEVDVYRNDQITIPEIEKYDKIILSPGPGIPSESGILLQVIQEYASKKPILGVCLGEQAIGESFGAQLINLDDVYHGIATEIQITEEDYIFKNIEFPIQVGRYHSWIVSRENLPESLTVTAVDENNQIMALKHKEYDIHGVQFHPESILTPEGKIMIKNFLEN